MKLKFVPSLVGAIAFGATLCALATTSHPLLAQDSTSSLDRVTSPTPPSKPRLFFPGLEGIELTAQQQAQIEQIMQEMQPQLRAILPPPPQLTTEQQAKLQQLEQSYRDRVEPVLTAEQRQQFQQNLQNLEQHRRNRSGNSSPESSS
ncbi:MAG TPA: hypothetical protein V6D50_03405 [Chroococcales cyanobacterium]